MTKREIIKTQLIEAGFANTVANWSDEFLAAQAAIYAELAGMSKSPQRKAANDIVQAEVSRRAA